MGKPQNMDKLTISEVTAIVTDELLSNEAFRIIIKKCVQKGLAKKLDKINDRLEFFYSKSFD